MSFAADKIKCRIAIGAIFKNEGPYILEWIAAHQAVGFDSFYIADNNSTDGSTELLQELDRMGIVRHIPFPGTPGKPPQLDAYAHIMHHHSDEFDWIGFIDADEYLVSTAGDLNIAAELSSIAEDETVGGIAINWAVYGSSNHKEYSADLTIKRFPWRSQSVFGANFHYKSFVRSSAFLKNDGNPHLFVLKQGFRYIHVDGKDVTHDSDESRGISQCVVWNPIRINHYCIRSKEEFYTKKLARGRATTVENVRSESFFISHDKNDEIDLPNQKYINRLEEKFIILNAALPNGILGEIAFKRPIDSLREKRQISGHIDRISVKGNQLVFTGWSRSLEINPILEWIVSTPSRNLIVAQYEIHDREDVARRVGIAIKSGFQIVFDIDQLDEASLLEADLRITSETESTQEELRFDKSIWPINALKIYFRKFIEIQEKPTMPQACIEFLIEKLRQSKTYVEYGTGGSTIIASKLVQGDIISVENDSYWLESVVNKVNLEKNNESFFHPIYINIGETKEWGYPVSDKSYKDYWRYPTDAWVKCQDLKKSPDLILIDGRFRKACFLAALLNLRFPCVILFDDYSDRPHYHSIEKFLKPSKFINRMAVFEINAPLQAGADLIAAYSEAITDVR